MTPSEVTGDNAFEMDNFHTYLVDFVLVFFLFFFTSIKDAVSLLTGSQRDFSQ